MANRNTLHRNHLPDFLEWLEAKGWKVSTPKGYYEVVRATRPGRQHPLLIYTQLRDPAHYTGDMAFSKRTEGAQCRTQNPSMTARSI